MDVPIALPDIPSIILGIDKRLGMRVMTSTEAIVERWMNDHLDLLNYAKQIGDTEWQQELIEKLSSSKEHTAELVLTMKTEELWRHFDSINAKMLEIYTLLRNSDNASEINTLKEEVWELKLQRIELCKQFKSTM